jgi:hypothetical protein
MVMTLSWKEWKLGDILYAIVVPSIVALLIIAFPTVIGPGLHGINPTLESILVAGLEEAILLVAVPMLLGLVWNQWAGGASGFLLGSIYALAQASLYASYGAGYSTDISLLGYVVSAMLVGYIAGALNKGSFGFLRMIISGLVATIVGGLLLFLTYSISPISMTTGAYGFFITIVPRLVYGIIIPIIAKLFTMFGVTPKHMS